jgi:O-antigen ligase
VIWLFSVVLWFGILTLRVPARWALTCFEVAICAFAIALIARRRGELHFHPVAILLAAAAAWGVLQIGLARTADVQHTSEAVLHWITNCAAFSVAFAIAGDQAQRRRFFTAQVIFAAVLSVGAVIGFFTIGELGPFVYRNQFAAYLEPILGLAIAAAIWDRRRSLLWILIAAALFASVVAGGSRAGSILCLAELIALPLIAFAQGKISGRLLARVAVAALIAAGALGSVVGWESIWNRLQEPHPYTLRANLARSSLEMARDRPLLGFGLGTWSDAYPAYARFDDGLFANQAHNDWAQWAAEGGVPFLLIMVAIVALLARPAFRSLWGLGLMVVFIHAFVDYPMQQRPALTAFFFALAGFL